MTPPSFVSIAAMAAAGEPCEPQWDNTIGQPGAPECADELPQRAGRWRLLRAKGADDQDRPFQCGAGEVVQQLQAGLIGGVQIVQREQDRRRGGELAEPFGNGHEEPLAIRA